MHTLDDDGPDPTPDCPLRRMRPALGTFVEVAAAGPGAAGAIAAAFAEIDRAQGLWSFHAADSELARLNGARGGWTQLSRPTLALLRLARALTARSGGAFDCTVGAELVALGVLPDHGHGATLRRGEAADIEIGPGRARLRRPLLLTLDGIAKGYAVDLAVAALRRAGCAGGWVNAGGDLRVYGDLVVPVWRRAGTGSAQPWGQLRDGALATSAGHGGRADARFPGRIVARAGRAAPRGTWSVLARTAWRADALTKVAANTPARQRAAAVAALGGRLVEVAP